MAAAAGTNCSLWLISLFLYSLDIFQELKTDSNITSGVERNGTPVAQLSSWSFRARGCARTNRLVVHTLCHHYNDAVEWMFYFSHISISWLLDGLFPHSLRYLYVGKNWDSAPHHRGWGIHVTPNLGTKTLASGRERVLFYSYHWVDHEPNMLIVWHKEWKWGGGHTITTY